MKAWSSPADTPTQIDDLSITLRSGETLRIDFSDSFTTVDDVLTAITNASPLLTAEIDPETLQAIRLTDTSVGSGSLTVGALPGSFAALNLGLVGLDIDGDGILVGLPLHGKTDSDRFFIDATAATLGGSLSLTAADVDATARFGFADVSIVDGTGSASASVNVTLTDPGIDAADGRITFDELFEALSSDVGSLFTVDGPTGSANFDLPIEISPAPLSPPGDPRLLVTLSDLFNPSTFVATISPEFDLLAGLENFAFGQIVSGLREIQMLLVDVENLSLLQSELPLVGTSVADLLELSTRFGRVIDRLEVAQPRTIAQFELSATAALEAEISGTTLPTVAITLINGSFDVDLTFGSGINTTLPLDFDLVSLGGAADNLISVDTGGELVAAADAQFNLGLTIDVSDPASPQFFVKDTTGITASANISSNNLQFDATVLVFDLLVRNGTADLVGNWTIGVDDDPIDGRYELFNEISTDFISTSLSGTADANLPVDLSTVGNPLDSAIPAIVLDINNLAAVLENPGSILDPSTLVLPDFAGLVDQVLADLRNNLDGLVGSWDDLFGLLDELVDGEVFGVPIPLIGNQLADAASFLTELRDDVTVAIEAAGNLGVQPVLDTFLTVLGPAGLNLLADVNLDGVITTDDIPVIATADRVEFDFQLHRDLTLVDQQVAFDIGLPALGLEVDGGVRTLVGFDFEFGFGFSKTEGVYLDVSKNNELVIDFEATIPNLDATGSLAFLQIDVTDDGADPSQFVGSFTVDVLDPGLQAADGRLSLSEVRSASADNLINATLTASADVNLPFVTSFAGSSLFPALRGDFNLDWQFNSATTSGGTGTLGDTPTVAFNNLQIDTGTFLSDLLGPTLGTIQQVLAPAQPLIDVLSFQIPVLDLSLIDLAKLFGNSQVEFIAAAVDLSDLVLNIPLLNEDLFVDLGSFDLSGTDVRGLSNLESVLPNTLSVGDPKTQLAGMNAQASNFLTQAENVTGSGFSFPIYDNPTSAFGLFLGKDVDLVLFDMAPLSLSLSKTFEIPMRSPSRRH